MPALTKEEATLFFSQFYGGEHHFPNKIKEWGNGWSMNHNGELATFDYNQMSRLVIMCHDTAIRASIRQGAPGGVKICIWKREREGSWSKRHPNIEDQITEVRSHYSDAFRLFCI